MIRHLLLKLMRLTVGLLLLLAGCKLPIGGGMNMYGSSVVYIDPAVQITDFTYTPSGLIHAGETMTFTASLSQPYHQIPMLVYIGDAEHPVIGAPDPRQWLFLQDQGIAPDILAGDGTFTGAFVWPEDLPDQSGLPVYAVYYDRIKYGTPLTVLPREEED